jgi:hypothetical protein
MERMSRFHVIYFSVLVLILASACHPRRNILQDGSRPIPGKGAGFIEKNALDAENEYEWFSAKIATQLEMGDQKNNFKTSVRIRKDSAIWAQITFGSVLIAHSIITPDSVKVILKRDKKYFMKDIAYLNDEYGLNLSFDLLQDLLTGNNPGFEKKGKYKAVDDSLFYMLSTHKAKKVAKLMDKSTKNEEKLVFVQYQFYPSNFKLANLVIDDIPDSTYLKVSNFNYKQDGERWHPEIIRLFGQSAKDSIRLELIFQKTEWNEKQEFPFNIGENYERID